jgi:hypothetical protein
MNLNKFTKAELISKLNNLKKSESKNSNVNVIQSQSIFSKLLEFISWFKALIFKITIISLIIKTFKKYSLFTKLFRIINWIILTIFGISLIDNFPIDLFLELRIVLSAIITYLSNTYFYSFIASIFSAKEDVTNQKVSLRNRPLIEGISDETTRSKNQSKGNSKIVEWLNPEPEIKDESDNTKYYIIAVMLIACITWYYWGDISPVLYNWFRRPRSGNDGTGTDNSGMNPRNIQSGLDNKPTVEQRIKDIFNKNSDQIELLDNTQNIATSSKVMLDNSSNVPSSSKSILDNSPSSSDNSMNHYFTKPDNTIEPQLTGLKPITGQDFTGESIAIVNEIDTFLNYHNNASFPKAIIGAGLYKVIRNRLSTLSDLRNNSYKQLIQDNEINEKINRFLDLEDQFYSQPNTPQNEADNLETQSNIETQSNTYEEVAVTNIGSRMAWSDRATPSVHSQVVSPIQVPTPLNEESNLEIQQDVAQVTEQSTKPVYTINDLLNQIRSRRDDSHVVSGPSNKISNLADNSNNLDDKDLMTALKETFSEDIGLKLDRSNVKTESSNLDLPKIDIDSSNSSDNSVNQYFTKTEVGPQDTKSGFSNLFDSIRSRRDDSHVVGSPNIGHVGLQPSSLSPLNTKPSISNLFDDTVALFEDDDELPISHVDKGKAKEVDVNLLSDVSNSWDKVVTNVHYGDSPNNIIVDLKYGDLWTRISKYRFVMNTGQVIDYDYNTNGILRERSFDLSAKIENNSVENVDIKEIILLDLNYRGNSVWKNTKYFS